MADRRTFLAAIVAGGLGGIATSCSGDSSVTDTPQTVLPTDGTGHAGPSLEGARVPPVDELTADPFSLGVCSGDPLADSVILWTRLAHESVPVRDIEVAWELSDSPELDRVVATGTATAPNALGHAVHVDATGLAPDTTYWYRFLIGEGQWVSPVGRTRTMPPDDGLPAGTFQLAAVSCQNFAKGYFTPLEHLAADQPDLVVFLGDYIYENPETDQDARPGSGPEPYDLAGYRARYELNHSDPHLRAARAAAPWVVTWDDHEVENDYRSLENTGDLDAEDFAARRFAAYQAYYEHQPMRLAAPTSEFWRIHRTVRVGSLIDLIMLDGRQYRDDHPCREQGPTFLDASGCDELDLPERSMLGHEQEGWLADQLRGSDAAWTALGQQTVMQDMEVLGQILNTDQWDGYPAARARLLDEIRTAEVANAVVLTGDLHCAGYGSLRTGDGTPVAVELVTTSVTSDTLKDRFIGSALFNRLPLGGFDHLNVSDHGYFRSFVTVDEWRTEFISVRSIAEPSAEAFVDATCVITSGTARAESI